MKYVSNYFLIILSLAAVVILTSCTKELDLNTGSCFDVKQFLESKNCKTKCNVPASCEGKEVCLRGNISDLSLISIDCSFQLDDVSSSRHSIGISIDSSICADVQNFLTAHQQAVVHVRGMVTGYDKPMNFSCKRGFSIELTDMADLSAE